MKKRVARPHTLRDVGTLAELLLIARQGVGMVGEAAVCRELPAVQTEGSFREKTVWMETGAVRQGLQAGVSIGWREAEGWVQRKKFE